MSDRTPLQFDIFTLFPAMFEGPLSESIIRRAVERALVRIVVHDIRTWTYDRHRTADDTPYGGGAGMVMKAPPIVEGVESILGSGEPAKTFIMAAGGRSFDQAIAHELTRESRIVLICGHYEGIDARVQPSLGADELSIGDYVLTGGELPAMIVVDAVTRLIPGVIEQASIEEESHADGLLEYPHFTRPVDFRGHTVPDVLLSGHHANIRAWRRAQAIAKTAMRRPDMLDRAPLSDKERAELARRENDPA